MDERRRGYREGARRRPFIPTLDSSCISFVYIATIKALRPSLGENAIVNTTVVSLGPMCVFSFSVSVKKKPRRMF